MRAIARGIQASLRLSIFLPVLAGALATTWYGLFWSVQHFEGLTGGLRFMDIQPWLTSVELFAQIRTYSDEAARFYLWWSMFDYAWPFVTYTAMLFITAWLFRFLPVSQQRWFVYLVTVAYLTVCLDWAENIGFAALVVSLPDEPMWLAQTSLLLHAGKLLFNMVFNAGFWIVAVAALVGRFTGWRLNV